MKRGGECVLHGAREEKQSCTKVKRDDTVSDLFMQGRRALCFHAFFILRGQLACVICMQS